MSGRAAATSPAEPLSSRQRDSRISASAAFEPLFFFDFATFSKARCSRTALIASAIDRVRALAPATREWKNQQPFKAVLESLEMN